jgi:hypothetical protein
VIDLRPGGIEVVKAEPETIGDLVTERILNHGKRLPTIHDMATLRVAKQALQESRFKKFGKDGVLTAFSAEEDALFSDCHDELEATERRLSYRKGWNSAEDALK